MKRIFLFLLTNALVILVASIALSLLGVEGILAENGSDLNLEHITQRLDQVQTDPESYLDFLRSLRDYGIAVIRGHEPIGIENMAGLIGRLAAAAYNPVFELKPQKNAHTLGNSTQVVPPHTDESYLHTPTGILVLYCINPAKEGGESVMVDGFIPAGSNGTGTIFPEIFKYQLGNGYDANGTPHPLVVAYHGFGGSAGASSSFFFMAFIALTTRKIANAMMMKSRMLLMKVP